MKTKVPYSMSMTVLSAIACLSVAAWGQTSKPPAPSVATNSIVAGRISYWAGKVNVHTDPVTSVWLGDSDCVSGAGIDPLMYCKKFYPKTTSVTSVPVTKKPPNIWNTEGCGQQYSSDGIQEWTCNAPGPPRIAYWKGKVNLHQDSTGAWTKDADCSSGAGIDPLTYCKKFYPATTSVTSVAVTTKPALLWNTGGCKEQYSGDGAQEFICNP